VPAFLSAEFLNDIARHITDGAMTSRFLTRDGLGYLRATLYVFEPRLGFLKKRLAGFAPDEESCRRPCTGRRPGS
jgi:hypothetical protein